MRICQSCRAAENPRGNLQFVGSPEGVLCSNCYSRKYAQLVTKEPSAADALVIVTCPDCRGNHPGRHGNPCEACCGYGVVRIAPNAIPVYKPTGTKTLMENSSDGRAD